MSTNNNVISPPRALIPPILYGTAWKNDSTAALVERALRLGFRGIDTACQPKHYDEPGTGAGIAACLATVLTRAQLYLQTKFTPLDGQDPARIPYDPKASLSEQVAQSFAASLRNLRTNYLDALVLHSPLRNGVQQAEVWQAMEEIVEQGGAHRIGISNCYQLTTLEQLYRSARIKPSVLQNRFHAETGYDSEIRAFCRDQGIVYQSFWTLTANPHILAHPSVRALAKTYQRTPEQILFRVLTQQGIVPLTGTRSETHMREDLAIFEFELSEEECGAVAARFGPSRELMGHT
jgi:diketogulonate reductase-like aldo/keto reductase